MDGNEYIDYVCSYGPGILGHGHAEYIQALQRRLMDGLKAIIRNKGLPALIQGPTGVFVLLAVDIDEAYTADDLKDVNWKVQSGFEKAMAAEGIFLVRGGRWFLSGALTERDVDQTLECAGRVIEAL